MLSGWYKSTEVNRWTWLHVPSIAYSRNDFYQVYESVFVHFCMQWKKKWKQSYNIQK